MIEPINHRLTNSQKPNPKSNLVLDESSRFFHSRSDYILSELLKARIRSRNLFSRPLTMVGGGNNPAKPTTNKPPSSSAPTAAPSSSSSHDRKSRWISSNNNGETSKNNNNKPTTTTGGQKIADKKLPKPNPSPKLAPIPNQSKPNHPNSNPNRTPMPGFVVPPPPFPFPDASAALGPPPPPTYGFHMLERRTIALVDGSIRSYFALPPNYQDFPPPSRLVDPNANRFMGPEFGRFPPFHPEEFRDQRQHWDRDRPEGSMKRKYPGEEEIDRRDERSEMMRQRQHQFMQYGNPHDQSLMAGTSSSFGEDGRVAKHMRIGGSSRHESNNGQGINKHLQVDQVALKKSFLGFVKRIYEDSSEKKKYLENGRKGRLQCLVCGRFDGFQSVYCVCYSLRCILLVLDTLVTLFLMVALIGLMCVRSLNEHEESKKEH